MAASSTAILALAVFFVAGLYSLVGHAGASGYLACMALAGLAPEVMKPTALTLNIFVASIASYKFFRAGCFNWNLFWPFAVTSIPCSFIGGAMTLPVPIYKQLLGCALLFCAVRLLWTANATIQEPLIPVAVGKACMLGAVIGFLSGLTGVGGGIFLSPLLLFCRWADARVTAGVSAVFILVNSVAGLLGHLRVVSAVPPEIVWWVPAAVFGGLLGAQAGARRLPNATIRRFLAVVLALAGVKMFLVQ